MNPGCDPILIVPHEGPEMVVVGDCVAAIDRAAKPNNRSTFGILLGPWLYPSIGRVDC